MSSITPKYIILGLAYATFQNHCTLLYTHIYCEVAANGLAALDEQFIGQPQSHPSGPLHNPCPPCLGVQTQKNPPPLFGSLQKML